MCNAKRTYKNWLKLSKNDEIKRTKNNHKNDSFTNFSFGETKFLIDEIKINSYFICTYIVQQKK